jgi:hypothetical protein
LREHLLCVRGADYRPAAAGKTSVLTRLVDLDRLGDEE